MGNKRKKSARNSRKGKSQNINWSAAVRRAERERDRNTGRIEAGETFRGHQNGR